MSDEPDDFGGGLDPDSEPNPEPQESEPIQSSWSDFIVGEQHKEGLYGEEEEGRSIFIDPLLEIRLNEVLGDDKLNPQSLFVFVDDIDDWSNVRGTAHATQLSALNYILEGGIQGFSFIVYDPEDDAYYVWVDYEE